MVNRDVSYSMKQYRLHFLPCAQQMVIIETWRSITLTIKIPHCRIIDIACSEATSSLSSSGITIEFRVTSLHKIVSECIQYPTSYKQSL